MRITFLNILSLRLSYLLTAAVLGFIPLLQQPLRAQATRLNEQIVSTATLTQLPAANPKIVAVVYQFRVAKDQQYLPQNSIQATAAANYTTFLFEVLRNSGWFVPTEYSNAGTLLNGQREQTSTSSAAAESGNRPVSQGPTVILEAGLLSQDASTLSDEAGSLYFAGGISNQYHQDRATVFLRALSAQSGKILKTVYLTKTVLSQPATGNTYRYVLVNQTNESLVGTTSTPSDQLAITEAIKQAVRAMIIEGIRDGLWITSMPTTQLQSTIAAYEAEKMNSNSEAKQPYTRLYWQRNSRLLINPSFINVYLYGGSMRYHGDYANWATKGAYGLSVEAYVTPRIGIQLNAATGTLASRNAFTTNLTSVEANLIIRVLPYWKLTPFVYGGMGVVSQSTKNPFVLKGTNYLQYQGGVGIAYSLNEVIGFRTMLSYIQPVTDLLDGKQIGSYNDFYVRTTLGLQIHFGHYVPRSTHVTHK